MFGTCTLHYKYFIYLTSRNALKVWGEFLAGLPELKEENISNPTGCLQAVDRDNSGYITVGELGMLGGGKLGNTKTEALMDKLDTDKDGRISLEEFRKLFKEK